MLISKPTVVPEYSCAIISIEGLQRRRFRTVDWTKLMSKASSSKSSLAFLIGPDKTNCLVLTRNYGAIVAVILDDTDLNEDTFMRIPSVHSTEFLIPYSDDLIAQDLIDQYDAIQLHLTTTGAPKLGPLTSARAAWAMKHKGMPVEGSIKFALAEGERMASEHAARSQLIENLLAAD